MTSILNQVKEYVHTGLAYFEGEYPGKALSYAKANKDIAPEIARKYLPELNKLNSVTIGLIKWAIKNYDIQSLAQPIIKDIIQETAQKPGKMGEVAREYPDWMYDQIRRILNLTILWLNNEGKSYVNETNVGER